MRLIDATTAFRKMNKLAASASRIDVAVAWAGEVDQDATDVCFGWMAAYGRKIHLVVGVSDAITSATLLERRVAQGCDTWIVLPKDTSALYHPKLYVFRDVPSEQGPVDHVFVGSANLTYAARDRNTECIAWLRARSPYEDDKLAAWLRPPDSFPATEEWVRAYRARRDAFRKAADRAEFEPPPAPLFPTAPALTGASLTHAFLHAAWPQFYSGFTAAMEQRADGLRPRHWLRVLDAVRAMDGWPDLNALSDEDWTRFVGRGGGNHPKAGVRDDVVHWPLFGRIEGQSSHEGLVVRRESVATALACIPTIDAVDAGHTLAFASAWADTGMSANAVSSASRLLALWRPDVFLPVTGASVANLREVCGTRVTTLAEYFAACRWLRQRPWATADIGSASDEERRIAGARVALLDGLFFDMG